MSKRHPSSSGGENKRYLNMDDTLESAHLFFSNHDKYRVGHQQRPEMFGIQPPYSEFILKKKTNNQKTNIHTRSEKAAFPNKSNSSKPGISSSDSSKQFGNSQVDQHLEEVHYILNKTIQVVARKVYLEDIYKQACDSRYWDIWNRQKLNSELELKRHHILSLNQDLTNHLVELERHFNALELNKFSQYGGHHIGRRASQNRYGPARHIQSLHSLQNAIRSQLVAAESLFECLSKQMTTSSLRSPTEEQKNVKKLFETIGIPYDASFGSPDTIVLMRTPSSKKLLFSDLTSSKDTSKRTQASAMKSCEPETARRRRDSLDQSWTCSEPPKTIIKRKQLQ